MGGTLRLWICDDRLEILSSLGAMSPLLLSAWPCRINSWFYRAFGNSPVLRHPSPHCDGARLATLVVLCCVVCLVPVMILPASMPAFKRAVLYGRLAASVSGLQAWSITERSFHGEVCDSPGRNRCGRWKDAEKFCTGEIIQ